MEPQYYYGSNFGYIVAFKQSGELEWRKVTLADPEARRYIHKDASLPPLTQFQVKVKAFNSRGEGPFSLTGVVYSALDGESISSLLVPLQQWSLRSFPQGCEAFSLVINSH